MELAYVRIRKRARQIVSRCPSPEFYQDYPNSNKSSHHHLETNPLTIKLREFVAQHLKDDFGHGIEHAIKVAIDAGALMVIENELAGYDNDTMNRSVTVVQCAGLLHDIMRKQDDHAIKGATYAREVLKSYPLHPEEVDDICRAIRNHEAFKETEKTTTPEGALVSDCLYDADKFRWGPDNFTDTVWAMVSFYHVSVAQFVDLFPEGMKKLAKIKNTFRTRTGKKYGPQFIDIGLAVGEELFEVIQTEFAYLL